MLNPIAYRVGESYWYDMLTLPERLHYERCITRIIAYYQGNIGDVLEFIHTAQYRHMGANPLIASILWRLEQEVTGNE
jgi:hypothetical protein